jgi:aspartyl-tRNA(Asn)/glutamyl-tRNA(Gln) amidotransferase subunit A
VHYLGLAEAGAAIAARELSSVELTRHLLDRIGDLNPTLHAYYTVFTETALEEARRADAELAGGRSRGALHGVPIAFKDLYNLGPTTAGSRVLEHNVATVEAAQVTRMRELGGVILGKLATHEFALAAATLSDAFPAARNPWDVTRTPGGSSTGAGVAVAAGLAFGAWGSDTGGSVRIPAAHCGVVGFKPTYGRLDLTGVIPLAWSLDHAGPLARSMVDAGLLVDPTARVEGRLAGVRLGAARSFWAETCDPQIAAAVESALACCAEQGAAVVEVDLGLEPTDVIATGYLITMAEAAAYHGRGERRPYGREFGLVLETGRRLPATAYVAAQRARRCVAEAMDRAYAECDLVVMPTVGVLADPLPEGPRPLGMRINRKPAPIYTWLPNLFGGPAVSVPCGFSAEGLPMGIQFIGRAGDDARVLAAAADYEAASGWGRRHPLP